MPLPKIDFGTLTEDETLELAKLVVEEMSDAKVQELYEWIEDEKL